MDHQFPFDPTYGYTLEALRQVAAPEEPADFAGFWTDTYRRTLAIPPAPVTRPIAPVADGHDLFEIEFATLEGTCGGWLSVPRGRPVTSLLVLGHGYGGRAEPGLFPQDPGAAVLSPCARGFDRSARPDVPSTSDGHVIHGIGHRETYIHRFNVAELWSAATVLLERYPSVHDRLHYSGSSFGGGIGALALAWDQRFARAFLEVPSFGDHPFRLAHPSEGSAAAVRRYRDEHGDVLPVLRYFDAATAARRVRIPVLAACALFDPAVPPPGQFAVYNALAGPKELFVETAGHFEFRGMAEEARRLAAAVGRWFAG